MSNLPVRRDEKHPINEYRPPSASTAYKLVTWKPVYDMIVAGHIMGRTNKSLAEEFDFTPVHISNILRSDAAQALIKQAHERIRANMVTKVEDTVEVQKKIVELSEKRKLEFLENEELAINSPFAYIDRVQKMVETRGPSTVIQNNVQNNTQNNVNNLSGSAFARMTKALEISSGIPVESDE